MNNDCIIASAENIQKETILDVQIHLINRNGILEFITDQLINANEKKVLINYVNAHGLLLAQKNPVFKNVLNQSSILFCDGFGVSLAARIQGKKMGERMTPPDWFDDLIQILIAKKKNVFFVGDTENVVKQFCEFLTVKYPELSVSGYNNGFFIKEGKENENLIQTINSSSTNVLITGMGMPIQEIWAYENIHKLKVDVVLSTGALFRHIIGVDMRGPKLFTDRGFEWLFRLLYNPRKFWKRYLIGIPHLFLLVLKDKFKLK